MIEDIILEQDTRGMCYLRAFLPSEYCKKAAAFLRKKMENVLITTGFYVSGYCETDGIVGTVMLAEALVKLGSHVSIVTDSWCCRVLENMNVSFDVYEFPIIERKESITYGDDLLSKIDPSLLIAVERCGRAEDGCYYNMRGQDISEHTAKIDFLFDFPHTIGVGDGGNEIGMGNVYDQVKNVVLHGEKIACTVKTTHLVISSVSNWGVYGLLAYLSLVEGKKLLKREDEILLKAVKAGAVDSKSGESVLAVDGFSLEETNTIIGRLNRLVSDSD